MKIAFISRHDTSDIHAWSGTAHYLMDSFVKTELKIKPIVNLKPFWLPFFKLKKRVSLLLSKNCMVYRNPYVLRAYARKIETDLQNINPDVLFTSSPFMLDFWYVNVKLF